jgi:pimeloyl-ACP methyl ester carboxylesterase
MPGLTTDDGRRLAWHEAGSGPPLLCHPGGPGVLVALLRTIREARRERVAMHAGQPYFEDAMAARQAHQEGRYASDEELEALYRREWRLFVPIGFDAGLVLEALGRAGNNADALRYFNEQIAAGMDQRPLLARVGAPTLVITGTLDPFESAASEIADALPESTLVLLPGADHFPFLEHDHGAAWSQAVLDFLEA